MGRIPRVKISGSGATYHVMTRTAHQAFFFEDTYIKERIYRTVLDLADVYYVQLHSIAVMDNHYHIVLSMLRPGLDVPDLKARFERFQARKRIPMKWYSWRVDEWYQRLTDLSVFMKDLNRTISLEVNRRAGKVGSIWGERFKSVLIEEDAGLLACMVYVEMNCVRANLCRSPLSYRWCSTGRFHLGGSNAAGVVVPKFDVFRQVLDDSGRLQVFSNLVDGLAQAELQGVKTPSFPELKQFQPQRWDALVELALRRSKWLVHSVVVGSELFCRNIIERFDLQQGQHQEARPYRLTFNLYNEHVRAGPHATSLTHCPWYL